MQWECAFATVVTRAQRRSRGIAAAIAPTRPIRHMPRIRAQQRGATASVVVVSRQDSAVKSWSALDCAAKVDEVLAGMADPARAAKMEMYLKGMYPCYGVMTPERRAATKPFLREYVESYSLQEVALLIDALWAYPKREMQQTGIDAFVLSRKSWASQTPEAQKAAPVLRDCFIRCTNSRPWWDTIDMLSSQGWGPLARAHPDVCLDLLSIWVDSEDVWERRVSILFQLRHGKDTDEELLFDTVRRRAADPEFWIRKAIGWALRTRGRANPALVTSFLKESESILSPLSLREARKGWWDPSME